MSHSFRASSAIGGVVLMATLALLAGDAGAQAPRRPYRIGVLNEAWAANHPTVEGLKAGLRELGFEEGRDVTLDIRYTEGKVEAGVDLIFTSNEAATQAAKAATQKLPIVFTLVGDPVAAGIVTKLAHPGGNLTGISSLTTELVPKRLEALKTLMPTVRRVWAIYYADDPSSIAAVQKAQDTAPSL
jgi:putative ABC transport system substrate-binding protein